MTTCTLVAVLARQLLAAAHQRPALADALCRHRPTDPEAIAAASAIEVRPAGADAAADFR